MHMQIGERHFYCCNIYFNSIHQNYLELNLTYNDGRNEFTGTGKHTLSGKEFKVINGEVNKKTKYWKWIAEYDGGIKKNIGKKELVQVDF